MTVRHTEKKARVKAERRGREPRYNLSTSSFQCLQLNLLSAVLLDSFISTVRGMNIWGFGPSYKRYLLKQKDGLCQNNRQACVL